MKATDDCKWDPIKNEVFVLYAPSFLSFLFVNIGLMMAPEAETSSQSRITIKYYIVVSDGVLVQFHFVIVL